jgi:hypothetical protein
MNVAEPAWDIDKLRGDEGEALVRQMRSAVLAGTCEVKTDEVALRTRRVYVEHECCTAAGWKPSGIAVTKAASWAFVLGRTVVWMPTWLLKNIARDLGWPDGKRTDRPGVHAECPRGSHPTRGVLVPVDELVLRSMQMFCTNQ